MNRFLLLVVLVGVAVGVVLASEESAVRSPPPAKVMISGRLATKTQDVGKPFSYSSAQVILRDEKANEFVGLVRINGSFAIDNLLPGLYSLEIISSDYWVDPAPLTLSYESKGKLTIKCKFWDNAKRGLVIPLEEPRKYFQARPGWNAWGLFKNPMVLMIGFTALMAIGLPKLMALDPEGMKELTKSSPNDAYQKLVPSWDKSKSD
ncbi:ER membrane protein complex subunit 7 [Pelomyxa schiedti]|nr:ER membrane protein complex subunit 7 [Pelomyxa schiedti]